ncbi:hypothetical protein [Plantactinospora sp. WMMB782]|uniref:hypothetical protein n=1 Tax=Plantactinospora sp. WMMB782 TaxID=3404121 RepID=UPI003B94BF55
MATGWAGPYHYDECVKTRQIYAAWGHTVGPCQALPPDSTMPGNPPIWYFQWWI